MRCLLDVNVLIAWAWDDHPHNLLVRKWLGSLLDLPEPLIHTCPITEVGFIRVSIHKSGTRVKSSEAARELRSLVDALGTKHRFLPDDLSSCREFPAWCKDAKHTTDAHLIALAEKHGLRLATLDNGIPGAFVIPE